MGGKVRVVQKHEKRVFKQVFLFCYLLLGASCTHPSLQTPYRHCLLCCSLSSTFVVRGEHCDHVWIQNENSKNRSWNRTVCVGCVEDVEKKEEEKTERKKRRFRSGVYESHKQHQRVHLYLVQIRVFRF